VPILKVGEVGGRLRPEAAIPGDALVFCDRPQEPGLVAAMCADEWESTVLGLRAGRISFEGEFAAAMKDELALYIDRQTECLKAEYVLTRVPSRCSALLLYLQDRGFSVLESLVEFSASSHAVAAQGEGGDVSFRAAREADIARCADMICLNAHSRYETDPTLGPAVEQRAYRSWLVNSLAGREFFFVAELGSDPVGFMTWRPADDRSGRIGLLAVAPVAVGRGVGRSLLRFGAGQMVAAQVDEIRVGTSGANLRAQRLYAKAGFSPRDTFFTLRKRFV